MPVCPVQVVGGAWLFSRLYCNIFVTLDVMMCTASILNLCAISIDRWVCSECVCVCVLTSVLQVWLQMLSWHLRHKCHPWAISISQDTILLLTSPHRNFKTSRRVTLFSHPVHILLIPVCVCVHVRVCQWVTVRKWRKRGEFVHTVCLWFRVQGSCACLCLIAVHLSALMLECHQCHQYEVLL